MSTHTHNPVGEQNSNESNIYPEDYEWLGIIYQEDVRLSVAFITPLAFYDNDNWHPVSKNVINKYFPNNGKAAIFSRDFFISKVGQICCFRPEPNQKSNSSENPFHSCYMVNREMTLASFAQVFNWTSRAKDSLDIPTLLEEGIQSENCFSRIIYIRHQNYLYGPIKLDPVADRFKPREYAQGTPNGGPPLLVSVYKIEESDFLSLNDGKSHLKLLDEASLTSQVTKEDWSQPQTAIKRALHASKGVATVLENIQFSDNRIRELARLSSKEGPEALQIEEATLKRVQYILKRQTDRLLDIQALIEDLQVDHPLLKAAREQEVRLRHTIIAQEAEEQIQNKKNELQEIQDTIQEASSILNNLEEDTKKVEQRLEQARELEREIQKRIEQLREEPLQVLADLHITAALFPLVRQSGQVMGTSNEQLQIPTAIHSNITAQQKPLLENVIQWTPNSGNGIISNNLQDLQSVISALAVKQHSVDSEKLKLCAATLLAGCIPAMSGFASASLLQAVSQVIAGGRMWSVQVPLTALTPLDLFGKIDLERHIFIPATGGLADIILQAQRHPQELALVLLEGIDRAPAMPVTVPLLRQYIQLRRNNPRPAPLSLFHPRAIAPDDPYLKLAQFTWPDNILVAVTLDKDTASFPAPEMLVHWLANITAQPIKTSSARKIVPVPSSFVPVPTWQSWITQIRLKASKNDLSTRIIEQRMMYEILTVMNDEKLDPDMVINELWPSEDEDEGR